MRRTVPVALLALSGCHPSAISIDVPKVEGMRSLILLSSYQKPSGGDESGIAIDLAAPSGLPAFPDFASGASLRVTALYYSAPLDRLGLTPGALIRAESDPSIALPAPAQAQAIDRSAGADGSTWRAVGGDELQALLERWRRKATCPEIAGPLREPLDLPRGCTLPRSSRSDVCYGTPRRWRDLDIDQVSADVHPGSVVLEADHPWLYHAAATHIQGGTWLARVRLRTATSAEVATRETLPVIALDDPNPGWSGPPQVRSDGLELFFSGTWPRGTAWSVGLLAAHRKSLADPWSHAERVLALVNPSADVPDVMSQVRYARSNPLLLPDWRTVVFFDAYLQQVRVAQRTSTAAADLSFGPPDTAAIDVAASISSMTLSCDRHHILYARRDHDPDHWEARSVEILSLNPPAFSAPTPLRTSAQPPLDMTGKAALFLAEGLDCQTLYLAEDFDVFVAARVPCPN